jgi:hypothetical protein
MMFTRAQGLGFIPYWYFSGDPAINIAINPYVKIPPSWPMGQRTIQPIGYIAGNSCGDPLAATDGLTPMNGLGITMASWQQRRADLGMPTDIFDSWPWRHRKPLVIVGLGLLGLAALSGLGTLLR